MSSAQQTLWKLEMRLFISLTALLLAEILDNLLLNPGAPASRAEPA